MSRKNTSGKHGWLNATNELAGFVSYPPQQQQRHHRQHYGGYNDKSGSSSSYYYYYNRMTGKFAQTYRLLIKDNNNGVMSNNIIQEDINNKLIDPDYIIQWNNVVCVDINIWYKSLLPICPICLCKADIPTMPQCGHVMCLSCAIRYLQQEGYNQCCVCNVALTLNELKPVRIEIAEEDDDDKQQQQQPKKGDIVKFTLCEVVDGVCRPFNSSLLQHYYYNSKGVDDDDDVRAINNNKTRTRIQIPPRLGIDFGWRYSRVVRVNNKQINRILNRELKRLNNRINNEEWVDDLEAMGVYMAQEYVLKQLKEYDNNNNEDDDDDDDDSDDEAYDDVAILKPDNITNNIIIKADNNKMIKDEDDDIIKRSDSSVVYMYQLLTNNGCSGGLHIYLDPLWFKCLMVEYTGKSHDSFHLMYKLPRTIECRIMGVNDIFIDDISIRKKYRSLSHLMIGSTGSIIDVDFIQPPKLSYNTMNILKTQIDRRYKYRKEKKRKEYKEDKLKEAQDKIQKDNFSKLIKQQQPTTTTIASSSSTTRRNVEPPVRLVTAAAAPATTYSTSNGGAGSSGGVYRIVTKGNHNLTTEERELNSEEELERQFAPPLLRYNNTSQLIDDALNNNNKTSRGSSKSGGGALVVKLKLAG